MLVKAYLLPFFDPIHYYPRKSEYLEVHLGESCIISLFSFSRWSRKKIELSKQLL